MTSLTTRSFTALWSFFLFYCFSISSYRSYQFIRPLLIRIDALTAKANNLLQEDLFAHRLSIDDSSEGRYQDNNSSDILLKVLRIAFDYRNL